MYTMSGARISYLDPKQDVDFDLPANFEGQYLSSVLIPQSETNFNFS